MKYLSITFDDGRADNYEIAYPIMKHYDLPGTIYCTTGYIDGSWKPAKWKSAGKPISIEQLHELHNAGWELGLHGDKHITEVNDLRSALTKMNGWGFSAKSFGFSMPNSASEERDYHDFVKTYLGKEILYIRKGRKIDTSKLTSKLLFAGYSILGYQTAYNIFNNQNAIKTDQIDTENIYTVVVRNEDKPKMIIRFLKQLPEETWIVFMLHSILPEKHPLYGVDSWNWSKERFNDFCFSMKKMVYEGNISVRTISDMIINNLSL